MLINTYTSPSGHIRYFRRHGFDNAVAGNHAALELSKHEPNVGAWDGDRCHYLGHGETPMDIHFYEFEFHDGDWHLIDKHRATLYERQRYSEIGLAHPPSDQRE